MFYCLFMVFKKLSNVFGCLGNLKLNICLFNIVGGLLLIICWICNLVSLLFVKLK